MTHYAKRFFGQSSLESETVLYITGLVTPLSPAQVQNINTFVKYLKTGLGITTLSEYFDIMYILAGETQESSLRNLVKNAHHATKDVNITFAALEGFTGFTNSTAYINTNYNMSNQAVRLSQNNSSAGFYSRTSGGGGNTAEMGVDSNQNFFLFQTAWGSGRCYIELSNGAGAGLTNNTRLGFWTASRLSSSTYKIYKNGNVFSNETVASLSLPNFNLFLLGAYGSTFGSNIQMSFAFAGKGLTDAEMAVLTNGIEAYMDNNGKGVI
jgi:hypothetical protein